MLMCGKLWSCVTWCFNTTRREVKVSKKKYAQDYLENCEYIHTAPTFALAIHNLCSQIPLGDFFCNLKTPRTCRVQLLSTSKQFSFFMYKKPKEIFKKKKTLEDWEQPTNKSFDQGGGSVKRSVCVERVSACVCVRVQVWSLTSRCTPFSFASDETWAKFLASGLTGSATTVTAILCLPELAGQCACSPPRIQLCLPASSLPSPRCTPRLANTWCINVKSKFEIAFNVFENVERERERRRRRVESHKCIDKQKIQIKPNQNTLPPLLTVALPQYDDAQHARYGTHVPIRQHSVISTARPTTDFASNIFPSPTFNASQMAPTSNRLCDPITSGVPASSAPSALFDILTCSSTIQFGPSQSSTIRM